MLRYYSLFSRTYKYYEECIICFKIEAILRCVLVYLLHNTFAVYVVLFIVIFSTRFWCQYLMKKQYDQMCTCVLFIIIGIIIDFWIFEFLQYMFCLFSCHFGKLVSCYFHGGSWFCLCQCHCQSQFSSSPTTIVIIFVIFVIVNIFVIIVIIAVTAVVVAVIVVKIIHNCHHQTSVISHQSSDRHHTSFIISYHCHRNLCCCQSHSVVIFGFTKLIFIMISSYLSY